MHTIDKNGALHDRVGRYAEKNNPQANHDLNAVDALLDTKANVGSGVIDEPQGDDTPRTGWNAGDERTPEILAAMSLDEIDDHLENENLSKEEKEWLMAAKEIKLRETLLRAGAVAAIGAVAIGGLAGCSSDNGYEPYAGPGYEQVVESPEPEVVETPAPTPEPEPEPEVEDGPELVAYADATPGDWIDPADVEAARNAGLSVWVNPNGGPALVVEPGGPIPDPIREVIEQAIPARAVGDDAWDASRQEQHRQTLAMWEAGLDGFIVFYGQLGSGQSHYRADTLGMTAYRWHGDRFNEVSSRSPYIVNGNFTTSTPEEALSHAQWVWSQLEPGREFPHANVIMARG